MAQTTQKWDKILELLFEFPNQSFTVREIAKRTTIPSSSVQRYLRSLKKSKVVAEDNKIIISRYTKFKKAFFMINKLYEKGLIDYIIHELNPSVIIVFGSIRKGEYDKDSDIDLFVESSIKKHINLKNFEKKLKHKIQVFIKSDIKDLQQNLFNNIINGIKLFGSLKIK